jgi:Fe-S-cluster containining protein
MAGEMKSLCAGCAAHCCRDPKLHVDLQPEEYGKYNAVPAALTDKTEWWLARDQNGECVYLIEGRCSIYSTRPVACKAYDCRVPFITGERGTEWTRMLTAVEQWSSFELRTRDDRIAHYALQGAYLSLALHVELHGIALAKEGARIKTLLQNYEETVKATLAGIREHAFGLWLLQDAELEHGAQKMESLIESKPHEERLAARNTFAQPFGNRALDQAVRKKCTNLLREHQF